MLYALKVAGFDLLGQAEMVGAFQNGSKAGDMATFHAETDGLLIVIALCIRRVTPPMVKAGWQYIQILDVGMRVK